MLSALLKVLVALCVLAQAFAGAPTTTKISASIKDTTVNGLEGFNINVAAPFKVKDYLVGFRYALGDLRKLPESIFARRSFDTAGDGTATVDAQYRFEDRSVSVGAAWKSEKHGLAVLVDGDSKQRLKQVEVTKSLPLKTNKLVLNSAYNVLRKSFRGCASLLADSTVLSVEYDSEDQSPTLSVSRTLDANNEVTPSICLRTGDVSYAYTRKWEGGQLNAKFFPGEKLDLVWRDQGARGLWATSAHVPINDVSATKVSVAHEWAY